MIIFIKSIVFFRSNESIGYSIGLAGSLFFITGILLLFLTILAALYRSIEIIIMLTLILMMVSGVVLMTTGIMVIDQQKTGFPRQNTLFYKLLFAFCFYWQKFIMTNKNGERNEMRDMRN